MKRKQISATEKTGPFEQKNEKDEVLRNVNMMLHL